MAKTSLAEKLAECGAAIGDLVKEGDNGQYTYLKAADVSRVAREQLFKRGIIVVPTRISWTKDKPDYPDDIVEEVRVYADYRVTDGESEITGSSTGVGRDYEGKAAYMALTGALKYFLINLLLIPGIDAEESQGHPPGGIELTGPLCTYIFSLR